MLYCVSLYYIVADFRCLICRLTIVNLLFWFQNNILFTSIVWRWQFYQFSCDCLTEIVSMTSVQVISTRKLDLCNRNSNLRCFDIYHSFHADLFWKLDFCPQITFYGCTFHFLHLHICFYDCKTILNLQITTIWKFYIEQYVKKKSKTFYGNSNFVNLVSILCRAILEKKT